MNYIIISDFTLTPYRLATHHGTRVRLIASTPHVYKQFDLHTHTRTTPNPPVSAISCYQCNSEEHPECETLDVRRPDLIAQFYQRCDGDYQGAIPFCRKIDLTGILHCMYLGLAVAGKCASHICSNTVLFESQTPPTQIHTSAHTDGRPDHAGGLLSIYHCVSVCQIG